MTIQLQDKPISAKSIKELRKTVKLTQPKFAKLSNNSRETLITFEKSGRISKGAKRGITEAVQLLQALSEIMEPRNISSWLTTTNPNFRNKSPLDLIEEGRVDIIWSIIEETRQGAFA